MCPVYSLSSQFFILQNWSALTVEGFENVKELVLVGVSIQYSIVDYRFHENLAFPRIEVQ